MRTKKSLILALVILIVFGFHAASFSQAKYPTKQIEIICAHRAGGGIDLFFRLLSEELKNMWKIPVNVNNQTAANGAMAANAVINSKKDGSTLLAIIVGSLGSMTAAKPDGPIHLIRDFDPIFVNVGYSSAIYLVRNDSKFKTLKDMVTYAREKPGELICGTGPRGVENYLQWEWLKRVAKIDVPTLSLSAAEVIPQLLGGHIQIGTTSDVAAKPYIDAGRLRALNVDIRSAIFPELPTFAEAGFPEINLPGSICLVGPKGMPSDVVKAWQSAFDSLLKHEKFITSLKEKGYNINFQIDPEKNRNFFKGEIAKYSQFTPEELGWQ